MNSILKNNMSPKLKGAKGAYAPCGCPSRIRKGPVGLYMRSTWIHGNLLFFVTASCSVGVKIEEKRKINKYNSDVCMLCKQEISMYAYARPTYLPVDTLYASLWGLPGRPCVLLDHFCVA